MTSSPGQHLMCRFFSDEKLQIGDGFRDETCYPCSPTPREFFFSAALTLESRPAVLPPAWKRAWQGVSQIPRSLVAASILRWWSPKQSSIDNTRMAGPPERAEPGLGVRFLQRRPFLGGAKRFLAAVVGLRARPGDKNATPGLPRFAVRATSPRAAVGRRRHVPTSHDFVRRWGSSPSTSDAGQGICCPGEGQGCNIKPMIGCPPFNGHLDAPTQAGFKAYRPIAG